MSICASMCAGLSGCFSPPVLELTDTTTSVTETAEPDTKAITSKASVVQEIQNWELIGTRQLTNPDKRTDFFKWDRSEMLNKFDDFASLSLDAVMGKFKGFKHLSGKSLEFMKNKNLGDFEFDIVYAQTLEVLFYDTNTACGYVGVIANTNLKPDGSRGELETKECLFQVVFTTKDSDINGFEITEFEFREDNGQIELLNPDTHKYDINDDERIWKVEK